MQPRTSPRHKALAFPVCAQSRKKRSETFNRCAGGAHHRYETTPVLRQHKEHPHPQKLSVAGADKLRTTRCRMVFTAQTLRDSAVRPKRRHRVSAAYGRAGRSPKKVYRRKAHRSQESPVMFWAAQAGGGLAFAGAAPKNKTARLQTGD